MGSGKKQFFVRLAEEVIFAMTDDMDYNTWQERVKTLLQEFEYPQNPLPGRSDVISLRDVVLGAKFLVVGYGGIADVEEVEVTGIYPNSIGRDFVRCSSGKDFNLGDAGIVPYPGGRWCSTRATFYNNAFTRRSVAEWLGQQKLKSSRESARRLIEMYPEEFPSKSIIDDSQIVGRLN